MPNSKASRAENTTLFAAALLVAVGGLVYELILGTTASYLIGDSITSFSLATGITLFGMGIGSLLVKYIRWRPSTSFAVNEIALGFIGGNSVLILHLAFTFTKLHWAAFSAISLAIGVLIGLEIPLLVKMFAAFGRKSSVELLSKVLAIDYFGALVASLVFPLLLLPQLGLMRSAYLVATLNIAVAVAILFRLKSSKRLLASSIAVALRHLQRRLPHLPPAQATSRRRSTPRPTATPSSFTSSLPTRRSSSRNTARICASTSIASCSFPASTRSATTRPWQPAP